ncbi:ATP12 family protein [Thermaurantiacus sp.]
MRRFWRAASAGDDGRILLDGRPVRTPKGAPLQLPTPALAAAVAAEWHGAPDRLDPRALPLTGLANAAIDLVAPDVHAFAEGLAAYAAHDLTCYRAEGPPELVGRQVAAWEPVLKAVERTHGLVFRRTTGVASIDQPPATLARVATLFAACDPFTLAALSPLVTIPGSAVIALALLGGQVTPGDALAAAEVDERFQEERWGADGQAQAARAARARTFLAAARFLALLRG